MSGWGATLALAGALVQAAPLGTAFSYQGRLADDGNAAQGTYDLRFTLYDAASAGTQVGPALTNGAVPVTGGLFTATVDFGTSAFTGEQRWLEIAVRTNGGGAFVALNPRQPLFATPHSLYAAGAGRATLATTATTANSVSAGNIAGTISLAQLPGVLLTNNQNGVALSGTFSGNGSALTGLSAANISSGSLADARLSANVALLSGSPTFAGPLTAPSFSGSGAGLTGLDSWQLTGPLTVSTSAIPIRVGGCATPGTAFGIVMSGNYAYVADGPQGLQVIDISNPANPQRVGGYNTTGQAWDVAVSGNFAYVADESAGLQVIDISNPANPQRVGGYGTASYLKGVAVAGNYAYVADGETGLRVLNISSPANPQLVGGYNSDGWAYGVTVSGNYAFLADGYEGLQVIDISNPANPQRIGGYNTTGFAARIALAGNYACVADYDGGLQVIDVSNPANPQRVGGCDTVGTAWNVAVAGNYAYVADAEAGLQVIDITKPSDPRSLGAYHSAFNCYAVALRTDYAYLASGGLQVLALNATAAAAPAFQGDGSRLTSLDASQLTTGTLAESRVDSTLARDNEVFPLVLAQDGPNSGLDADLLDGLNSSDFAAATHSHDAKDINSGTLSDARLSPNVALLSSPASFTGAVTAPSFRGNASSLTDLDSRQLAGPLTITTSTAPVKLGGCDQASGYGVVVAGNYAYVAGGQAGLHVVDVSNPVNPQRVGGFDTPGKAWGVALAGNYAYIADEEAGLQVIDISNPANPQRVGGYDTPGYAKGVAVAGSYAYVADGETGLQVLDISNPANPQRVGGYDTVGWAYGVTVAGNYAYVADGYEGGVQVLDISNPANPQRVGGYDTAGFAARIAVAGNHAYVADYTEGLQAIDIGNPANPQRTGGYDTTGIANDVAVSGNYAYVADGPAGLQVIDISNPANPRNDSRRDTGGNAYGIAVVGNRAYLATSDGGLQVWSLDATVAVAAAPAFQGDGSRLTSLDASQLTTGTLAESHVDSALARDNEVFPLVLAQDGPNSGLDADLLDGLNSSDFAAATHRHDATDINSGTLGDARLSPNVALLSGAPSFTGTVTAPAFAGSGASLTGLSAANLTGALPSAQLSGSYSNALSFTNAANTFVGGFSGNAGGLTNIPLIALPGVVVTNGASGLALSGNFNGNGAGLTSLNASQLSSGAVPDARLSANVARTNQVWLIGGNSGTTPGAYFVGTIDNQPLELKVDGQRALRLEPNAISPNVIGGYSGNSVANGISGATIGGGGGNGYANHIAADDSFIGGGFGNIIASTAAAATIAGGHANDISTNASYSAIGGGFNNNIDANSADSTIAGGYLNDIGGGSSYGVVGGGYDNNIAANSPYATIPGGRLNSATNFAFAAGNRAKANHTGAFVWADATSSDFASTANNQFSVRAYGGVRFLSSGQGMTLDGQPVVTASTTIGSGQLVGTYGNALTLNNPANSFTGNGSGLSSLNASQLTSGTLPDARLSSNVPVLSGGTLADSVLSANVALLNNSQTFTGAKSFNNVGNSFSGNAGGLYNLNATQLSTGTVPEARLPANVALLAGNQTFTGANTFASNLRLSDRTLYLRQGSDLFHGLAWFSSGTFAAGNLDGPVLFGNAGGALGTTGAGQNIALHWNQSGNVGIGRQPAANRLEVAGNASKDAAGSWLANSDARIKTHINTITNALDTLAQVRPVSFRYTDEYRAGHPAIEDHAYVNVVAQEFQQVFPDSVKGSGETLADGSEILQVDTYPLTIYSAAAIQELHQQLKARDAEIASLKQRLDSIERILTRLTTK